MTVDVICSVSIVVAVCGYLFFKSTKPDQMESTFFYILLVAFVLRIIMALIINLTDLIPVKYYADSRSYQLISWRLSHDLLVPTYSEPVKNYTWLLSILFRLLGYVPITANLLSGVIGVSIVRNVYRITEKLTDRNTAAFTAGIWAILPSAVFVTGITFRDPIVIFLITTVIYWMVRIEEGREPRPFLLGGGCAVFLWLVCFLRPHQMTISLIALIFTGLASFWWEKEKNSSSRYCLQILGVLAFGFILFNESHCTRSFQLIRNYGFQMFEEMNKQRGLSSTPKQYHLSELIRKEEEIKIKTESELIKKEEEIKTKTENEMVGFGDIYQKLLSLFKKK